MGHGEIIATETLALILSYLIQSFDRWLVLTLIDESFSTGTAEVPVDRETIQEFVDPETLGIQNICMLCLINKSFSLDSFIHCALNSRMPLGWDL